MSRIPRPDQPPIDKKTGLMDRVWYRWLSNLFLTADDAGTDAGPPPIDPGAIAASIDAIEIRADQMYSAINSRIARLEDDVLNVQLLPGVARAQNSTSTSTALTNAHIFVGNSSNIAADVAMSGDITITNAGVTTIGANNVTLAKFVQATTTKVAVGRNSASGGNFEEVTATQILDWVGTAAQGDVLYRGASAWAFLAAGTSGQFLKTGGSGANPSWATVGGSAGTGTTLAAEILADSPTAYWKCDEASGTLTDYGAGGFHLTTTGTTVNYQHSYLLPNDTAKYIRFASTNAGASITNNLGTSPPLTGDWTIEAVVVPEDVTNATTIFALGLTSSETEANNLQVNMFLSSGGTMSTNWESGAGTDRVTAAPYANVARGGCQHFVAVKDGTANTVTFFRNGRQVGNASGYSTEPTGGTGSIKATIGDPDGTTTRNMVIGHVAFYNGSKLSAARVYAHALAAGLVGGA